MPGVGVPPFEEVANEHFLAEDTYFNSEERSLLYDIMTDVQELRNMSEEEFLNVVINDEEVNVIRALFENGQNFQLMTEPDDLRVPMWPQPEDGHCQDNVVVSVEVITSTEEGEDPVYTDLDSHGSSGDEHSDYGSESGTDQNSDMDLSQHSVEIHRQLELLQNAARAPGFNYVPEDALREIQLGQSKMEEDFIKREQPFYQVPTIKLEPGLGLGANMNNGKEMIDLNHNQQYQSNNCVKVENIYPKGVIPSVVTSDDEMDDAAVDSGTESCDSKDSVSNKKGERKRPGRKKGQVSKVYHLWEFIRDMLADPRYCPNVIKWENEEEGIFRVIQSETVAALWGAKKNNRTKMTYEKMSRSIRYSRKEGYFADIPKNRGYPKKLCFKFGGKAHGWRQIK